MHDSEAIQMMRRSSSEIKDLRAQCDRLAPKAQAYDLLTKILDLLPGRSQGYTEDLAYALDKRIKELEDAAKADKAEQAAEI